MTGPRVAEIRESRYVQEDIRKVRETKVMPNFFFHALTSVCSKVWASRIEVVQSSNSIIPLHFDITTSDVEPERLFKSWSSQSAPS